MENNVLKIEKKSNQKQKVFNASVLNRNKKYYAIFLVKEQGTFNILGRKRINPHSLTITYGAGNTRPIDVSKPTYAKGLKLYFFIDINKGQLTLDGDSSLNTKLIHMVLKQSIVKQLTSSLIEKVGASQYLMLILTAIAGFGIGFIVRGYL